MDNIDSFCSTVYAFIAPCVQCYGFMIFKPNGQIVGYDHPNERTWRREGDTLYIGNEFGVPISTYTYCSTSASWFGNVLNTKFKLVLIAVLANDAKPRDSSLPKVLINTIPKSGTYFMEKALVHSGLTASRLHLSGLNTIDDYRCLTDSEIHTNPVLSRINLPIEFATWILKPGQHIVGHIQHPHIIDIIRNQDFLVFSAIRNLRNVMVSLYHFKLHKVTPHNYSDMKWRSVSDNNRRFIAFLRYYEQLDITFIKEVAQSFLDDSKSIIVRYEDLMHGNLNAAKALLGTSIDSKHYTFLDSLSNSLLATKNTSSPTLSNSRADWKQYWNDEVEAIFEAYGLTQLNKALGYDDV